MILKNLFEQKKKICSNKIKILFEQKKKKNLKNLILIHEIIYLIKINEF